MTSERFHAIPLSMIVKPIKESVFSEMATIVTIENEAAGNFVSLRQNEAHIDKNTVRIVGDEWPLLRDTIDKLLAQCDAMDASEGVLMQAQVCPEIETAAELRDEARALVSAYDSPGYMGARDERDIAILRAVANGTLGYYDRTSESVELASDENTDGDRLVIGGGDVPSP